MTAIFFVEFQLILYFLFMCGVITVSVLNYVFSKLFNAEKETEHTENSQIECHNDKCIEQQNKLRISKIVYRHYIDKYKELLKNSEKLDRVIRQCKSNGTVLQIIESLEKFIERIKLFSIDLKKKFKNENRYNFRKQIQAQTSIYNTYKEDLEIAGTVLQNKNYYNIFRQYKKLRKQNYKKVKHIRNKVRAIEEGALQVSAEVSVNVCRIQGCVDLFFEKLHTDITELESISFNNMFEEEDNLFYTAMTQAVEETDSLLHLLNATYNSRKPVE